MTTCIVIILAAVGGFCGWVWCTLPILRDYEEMYREYLRWEREEDE